MFINGDFFERKLKLMKIEIHDLGIVKQAEIDLKPLTVFIGHNGTGKTWTAYTLASIFSRYGYHQYVNAYLDNKTRQKYPIVKQLLQQLINEGTAKIDTVRFVDKYIELYINDVAGMASGWMNSFMASERADFENLRLNIKLSESKEKLIEKIKTIPLERSIAKELLKATKEEGDSELYFYTKGDVLDKLSENIISKFLISTTFSILHNILQDIWLFPTERTSFITFPFSSEDSDDYTYDLIDFIDEIGLSLPFPITNFLEMIFSNSALNRQAKMWRKKNPEIQKYMKLAEFLENNILHGKVNFRTSKVKKEILFHVSENLKLEMPIVSSMVKELAPLVLCLRYLVQPGDLLIIDEPEMNLHPAAQVEIIEFFAILVNSGLNVLITTHSPYIVDHIANLMLAAKHKNKKSIKKMFYLEQTDAFISQDKVSIYLFEDGTARDIVDKDGIIDWSTFGNVSSKISQIYSKLL